MNTKHLARCCRRFGIIPIQLMLAVASSTAWAVSFGFEADCNSRYVWRGLAFSPGWVAQPSAWVSLAGVTVSGWTDMPLQGDDKYTIDEVDIGAAYDLEWLGLSIEPSVAAYVYPTGGETSTELAVGFGYQLGPVTIASNHSVELLSAPGAYFGDVGLEYSRSVLNDRAAFETGGWVGVGSSRFNDANIGEPRSALNAAGISVGIPVSVPRFLIRPHAELSTIIDRVLRERLAADGQPGTIVSLGLSLGMEL